MEEELCLHLCIEGLPLLARHVTPTHSLETLVKSRKKKSLPIIIAIYKRKKEILFTSSHFFSQGNCIKLMKVSDVLILKLTTQLLIHADNIPLHYEKKVTKTSHIK